MTSNDSVFDDFLKALLVLDYGEEFNQLWQTNMHLMTPELHEAIARLKRSLSYNAELIADLENVEEFLLGIICRRMVGLLLSYEDDQERRLFLENWIYYLSSNSAYTQFTDFLNSEDYNQLAAYCLNLVKAGAFYRMCAFSGPSDMVVWFKHVKHLLLDPEIYLMTLSRHSLPENKNTAWAIAVWADHFAAIDQFDLGIQGYEIVKIFFIREKYPVDWAHAMHNIAAMYGKMNTSNNPEIQRTCIELLEQVLEVRVHERDPYQWALSMFNYGQSWGRLKDANEEQNLKKAISCLDEILERCSDKDLGGMKLLIEGTRSEYWFTLRSFVEIGAEKAIAYALHEYRRYQGSAFVRERVDTLRRLQIFYLERQDGSSEENMELAIHYATEAIQDLTIYNDIETWTIVTTRLAYAYLNRTTGNNDDNLEKAIYYAQAVLSDGIIDESLYERRLAQSTLGTAYFGLKRGNVVDNQNKGIKVMEELLSKLSIINDTDFYFSTIQNIAVLYATRISNNKAADLDTAIQYCRTAIQSWANESDSTIISPLLVACAGFLALSINGVKSQNIVEAIDMCNKVISQSADCKPETVATAHGTLGLCYYEHNQGDRSGNIEESIKHLEIALKTFSQDKNPERWGSYMQDMANSFVVRRTGNDLENIEKAIEFWEMSFRVLTRENYPTRWARGKNDLGIAYNLRIAGNKQQNLIKAINVYEESLTVRTKEHYAKEWAQVQHNLGISYIWLKIGDVDENRERAIECFENALSIREYDDSAFEYNQTLKNLAVAYFGRERGNGEENLSKTLDILQLSKMSSDRSDAPLEWALKQYLLARTHQGFERDLNNHHSAAMKHYEAVFEIITADTFPKECLGICLDYGLFLKSTGNIKRALQVLTIGEEAYLKIRTLTDNTQFKERQLKQGDRLYHLLVYCCLIEGEVEKAFEYVLASKGRLIAEKMLSQRPNLLSGNEQNISLLEDWQEIESLWDAIENIQQQLLNSGRHDRTSDLPTEASRENFFKELRRLHDVRTVKKERFAYKYPSTASTLNLSSPTAMEAMELAGLYDVNIIEYYYHAGGWGAFIISQHEIFFRPLPADAMRKIENTVRWTEKLNTTLPAARSEIRQTRILSDFYDCLIRPVYQLLSHQGVWIAPHELLHLSPFNLALNGDTGEYLYESLDISIISSTGLAIAQHRNAKTKKAISSETNKALIVAHTGNELNKLNFVMEEQQAIAALFSDLAVCFRENAAMPLVITTTLMEADYDVIHFCCHAVFNYQRPNFSGLFLNGTLTVEKILNNISLQNSPMVVMSACQTGLSNLEGGGELTGLTQAWIQSGAGNVISSLWSVNDHSTQILFVAFYQTFYKSGLNPHEAMRLAMQQIRNRLPYKNIFYWGAFQISGINSSKLFKNSSRL